MKNDTVSKELQYQELIANAQKSYLSESHELRWREDGKEINLWTYWHLYTYNILSLYGT